MVGCAGASWQVNLISAVLIFARGISLISSLSSPSSGFTGRPYLSIFCDDHVYHVSGTFLGHSQRSLINNRGEWRMHRLKNGLALWAIMSSGVDKYKRMCSRSSRSSRTLDVALLGCLSLFEPVGGVGSFPLT